jgi:pimeloyl-ACP methyl ester carboxylesterase
METKYLTVPGGKIAYDESGQGPLVVCVPGMGDLRSEFRFLAPQLVVAGYRVVTMDVRGHGETSTGWTDYSVAGVGHDIITLIGSLDAGPAVVVGNSMAAGAAVWAAVETPRLVHALVLIGPAVHGETSWSMRLLLAGLFARPWGKWSWMLYYATLFPTHKPSDWETYTAGLKHNLSQPGRLEALHQMMVASKAASEARLAQVSVPALILMGSRDPDFKVPKTEAEWVAGQVKGTYLMVAGAGHYPHSEMPEETAAHVLSFLQTLKVTTGAGYAA